MTDINFFYDESFDILALNERLLTMAIGHPQGSRSLQSGRVVILRDGVRGHLGCHCSTLSVRQSISNRIPLQYY